MRTLIVIERNEPTRNSLGEEIESWSTYITRWARKKRVPTALRAEEFIGRQFRSEVSYIFMLRYDDATANVSVEDRIKYGNLYYNIQYVDNIDDRNQSIEILAYQVQT